MKILITGITGFAGGYLATHLAAQTESRIFGVTRNSARLLPALQSRVSCFQGDLQNGKFVEDVIATIRPDVIFHLAGQPFVPTASHFGKICCWSRIIHMI